MKIRNSIYCRAAVLLCCGLYLQVSHALSLGNVEIESYLNQPLSFSIPVDKLATERWQPNDVLVSLAEPEIYHQQGLAYPWALGDIRLEVLENAEGRLFIRGRSKKVVRELLVALLIRVEWPKGSIQKEYTALIDVNGVTNIAPKPKVLVAEVAETDPAPIQLAVQHGTDVQNVAVQPFSGEALGADIESAVITEPIAEPIADSEDKPPAAKAAFPSQEDIYLYKVARGDVLSLLAQRFRGDVELPLHQYIHAINNENIEQYPQGMAELSIGQLIRIPNPQQVAAARTYSKRQLINPDENVSHHRYRVRYGDSLFLIARAFKPEGVDTDNFIQTLVTDNPEQLSSAKQALQPRIELRIANANYIEEAAVPEPAPELEAEPALKPQAAQDNELSIVEAAYSSAPLTPVSIEGLDERRSINPRLQANLRAIEQYVGSDEKNLVYEVIQTNNRLPLLYEQVLRLNQQVSSLRLDMAEMQASNQRLQQELDTLHQQQIEKGASRALQWFLLALIILLLLAGLAMYLYIRRLARDLDFQTSPAPLSVPAAAEDERPVKGAQKTAPRLKELLRVKSKPAAVKPVVVGEQDYRQYDISKSNYDYSQAYDVGALTEKMKSQGNAFEQAPASIEFETYAENLATVKKLIAAEEFIAAELLLDKLLAADSSQFDNWLARLELQLRTQKQQEADALYVQLQQMFTEPQQLEALASVMYSDQPEALEEAGAEREAKSDAYPAPDADMLYETRVYLSYSHLAMAEQTINSLLDENPTFPETLLLKLEWLSASKRQAEFHKLRQDLEQRMDELSEAEQSALEKLVEEAEFDDEENVDTLFDDSTQLLSQFDAEADEANADMTAMLDEGLELDELEELDEPVIEAETDDEKEFLAAIQEQMESYSSAEAEDQDSTADKAVIPDDIRITD